MKSQKMIDIWEGEYRVFFNFFQGKEKVSLGFPKKNMKMNDVYISVNNEEQQRISFSEAKSYLNQGMVAILEPKVKGLNSGSPYRIGRSSSKGIQHNSGYGFCDNCGKKLRGDRSKDLCYECWSN